jgi:hypothetical protein
MMKSLTFLPLFLGTALLFVAPADAAVVVSGASETSAFLPGYTTVGTRHREFESTVRNGNDQEHFLGRNDLGGGPNRSAADHRYVLGDNAFSLSLVEGTLTSVMNGNMLSRADIFTWAGADAEQPFDTLQFSIRDGALGNGLIALDNLLLSGTDYRGNSITNVALGSFAGVDGGGFRYWTVTGIDFRRDFTFSGTLSLTTPTGSFSGSSELNRVEFTLGNGPITQPAVPEPATWLMMIAGFAFVGMALRGRQAREVA